MLKEFRAVRGLQLIKLPRGVTTTQALRTFSHLPDVAYVEPNYIIDAFVTPNDSRFAELWGMHNTGQTGGSADADIDAPEAWDLTTGTTNAVVAVIDTGIDYAHPDLVSNLYRNTSDCNADGLDDDGNGYVDDCYGIDTYNNDADPMDDHGHGTHVAGTIGATANNGTGVAGVNWVTSIMACKFLDASGSGTTAGAISCLDYIATMKDRGVNIIATNNSWGGSAYSQALRDAIDLHRQRGILFIAAAGNFGSDNDSSLAYPCSLYLPNIVCVASTDASDNRSGFSNYGRRSVHLGAPGEGILSTTLQTQGSYTTLSGTSMAAPHVTETAALLYALLPSSDWRAARNRLLASGDATDAMSTSTVTGRRLNIHRALTCSNSTVLSRVRPLASSSTVGIGTPIELAALHVNCAVPNGDVTVTVSPGGTTITLQDNGQGNDQIAGDGIHSAVWISTPGGPYTLTFPNGDIVTVTIDADLQAGFPVQAYHGAGMYQGGPSVNALVANLNNDSSLEIVATSLANGPLNGWNASGILLNGWPIFTPGAAYPSAGELSAAIAGNEIFSANWSQPGLTAFDGSTTLLPGWPRNSANYISSTAALADIDGDGIDEIFIGEEDWQLHGYRANSTVLSGWPVSGSGGQRFSAPAIGDLDGDGDLEIVALNGSMNGNSLLYVLHHTGAVVTGFPITIRAYVNTFPTLGDVDGNGQTEIVIVAVSNGAPVVLVVNANGAVERSIPLTGTVSYGTAPALADLDGDGIPEIVVQTNEALNVVRGNGATFPGWPVTWGGGLLGGSAPAVGDVDGDSAPDIVVTTRTGGAFCHGLVHMYGRNGVSHPRFPRALSIGDGMAPAIADIDRDGRNEIVIAGDCWLGYSGYYDKVWVFDLGGPAHGPVLWGQFMGNEKHTGVGIRQLPAPPTYHTLDAAKIGGGSITSNPAGINCGVDCSENYVSGTSIMLTATADASYRFNAWSGACAGPNPSCTVLMNSNRAATAEFVPIQYALNVARTGTGNGSVVSTPAGINCGNTCTANYNAGTSVSLTANATNGSNFGGWNGACAGQGATCILVVGADVNTSATFDLIPSNTSSGSGGGGGGCTIGNGDTTDSTLVILLIASLIYVFFHPLRLRRRQIVRPTE